MTTPARGTAGGGARPAPATAAASHSLKAKTVRRGGRPRATPAAARAPTRRRPPVRAGRWGHPAPPPPPPPPSTRGRRARGGGRPAGEPPQSVLPAARRPTGRTAAAHRGGAPHAVTSVGRTTATVTAAAGRRAGRHAGGCPPPSFQGSRRANTDKRGRINSKWAHTSTAKTRRGATRDQDSRTAVPSTGNQSWPPPPADHQSPCRAKPPCPMPAWQCPGCAAIPRWCPGCPPTPAAGW